MITRADQINIDYKHDTISQNGLKNAYYKHHEKVKEYHYENKMLFDKHRFVQRFDWYHMESYIGSCVQYSCHYFGEFSE